MFVIEIPLIQTGELTGRSNKTITDWYNLCREVCTAVIKKKTNMLGTHANPIQIDEARLAGRRKYNRGRMLGGDKPPINTDEKAQVQNNRNHGARVDGPWVFGLKQGNDSRYFYVERRDIRILFYLLLKGNVKVVPSFTQMSGLIPTFNCRRVHSCNC